MKAKDLSKNLLKNESIFKDSTLEQQEFKQFLNDFLQDYPHIERYKLYEPLLTTIIQVLKSNYHGEPEEEDEINNYKFYLILQQNFLNLLQEYGDNYKKFIKEKFLAKFEDFQQQLEAEDLKDLKLFNDTIEKIKSCENYECVHTNNNMLLMTIKADHDTIRKYKKLELRKCLIYFLIAVDNVSKEILRNKLFQHVSFELKHNMTQDINDFVEKFESNNDIELFAKEFDSNEIHFLKKYFRMKTISSHDRKLLGIITMKVLIAKDDDELLSKYDLAKNYIMEVMVYTINYLDYSLKDKF